jgi:hypothetical protein
VRTGTRVAISVMRIVLAQRAERASATTGVIKRPDMMRIVLAQRAERASRPVAPRQRRNPFAILVRNCCDPGATCTPAPGIVSAAMRTVPVSPPPEAPVPLDAAIAARAAEQHGVVSRAQLRALGMSDAGISRALARGRLHALHRGVFAVGHTLLRREGHWMAAVLAMGGGARLSHGSAAALWDLGRERGMRIHLTLPGTGGRRRRAGLAIHRARALRPEEVDVHRGIPVTSPARTLLDLAAILDDRGLERALDRAELLELTDYPALDALARACFGHRGAAKLRRALETHEAGTTITKGKLEELFLALCRQYGLPKPLVNAWLEAKEVDFLFPQHRLIVETDGWTHHRGRDAFENDRARDALMARAGYRTLRFTWRQIEHEPASVAATLAATLGAS